MPEQNTKKVDYQNPYYKIKMTGKDFRQLSSYINKELGIKMPEEKKVMLQSRLLKRLSELKIESFREYIDYVFSKKGADVELINMIDLVTTNKTDFFREPVHFEFLNEFVLPELVFSPKKIKLWSAGCSSGEEPYTLAITMSQFLDNYPNTDYEILATDLSSRILRKAATAIYDLDRVEGIPLSIKKKYFLKSKDPASKTVRIIPELRAKMRYRRLNFMDPVYHVDADFDIIFCRNVLIYFNRPTQEAVINKLASNLRRGGFFFLGHSESIANMDVPLQQVKPTIFRKI